MNWQSSDKKPVILGMGDIPALGTALLQGGFRTLQRSRTFYVSGVMFEKEVTPTYSIEMHELCLCSVLTNLAMPQTSLWKGKKCDSCNYCCVSIKGLENLSKYLL